MQWMLVRSQQCMLWALLITTTEGGYKGVGGVGLSLVHNKTDEGI